MLPIAMIRSTMRSILIYPTKPSIVSPTEITHGIVLAPPEPSQTTSKVPNRRNGTVVTFYLLVLILPAAPAYIILQRLPPPPPLGHLPMHCPCLLLQ
eukprot:XP_001693618.1 predicted protein [Chlamydomonas reinhardtii]